MVKKKSITKTLITSFLIAAVIFLFGLYLGYTLDNLRVADVSNSLDEVELETLYYVTSQNYIDAFGDENESYCDLLSTLLSTLSPDLADIGMTLTSYENKNIFSGRDYNILKHKYFLLEVRAYTLFTQLKETCDYNFDLVLYFYDQHDESSRRQGYVLDNLVRARDNFYIFSFDRSFEEAIIYFLKERYDVTVAPMIIINDNKAFKGFTGSGEIINYLEN